MANEKKSNTGKENSPNDSERLLDPTTRAYLQSQIKQPVQDKKQNDSNVDIEKISNDPIIEEEPDTDPDEVLELSDGRKVTRRFIEASEVYNPRKREPQACEFWEFKDNDLAQNGRF